RRSNPALLDSGLLRGACHRARIRASRWARNDVGQQKTRPAKPGAFCTDARARSLSSVLEFERNVDLGAIGFNLALGIKLHIELDDFGNPEIAQGLAGPFDGGRGRLLP